jgi:hypothetical protein
MHWYHFTKLYKSTANAPVATVLGSIPASVGTVESEGRQMKQCWILYEQKEKNSPKKILKKKSTKNTLSLSLETIPSKQSERIFEKKKYKNFLK